MAAFAISLLFVCICPGFAFPQDNADRGESGLIVYREVTEYFAQPDGGLTSVTMHWPRQQTSTQAMDMLLENSVQSELALSDTQKKDVQRFQKQLKQIKESMLEYYRTDGLNKPGEILDKRLLPKLQKWVASLESRKNSILLPHQQNRLVEIIARYKARRYGLRKFLAENDEIELTPGEVRLLNATARSLLEKMKDRVRDNRAEAFEDLLKPLTADQRKRVQQHLEAMPNRKGPMELLMWQADYEPPTSENGNDPPWGINLFPRFDMQYDGTLRLDRLRMDNESDFETKLKIMTFDSVSKAIDVLDYQAEAIAGLIQSRDDYADQLEANFRAGSYDTFEEKVSAVDKKEEKRIKYEKKLIRQVDEVLLPRQREAFQVAVTRIEFLTVGPVASLTHGRMGKRLGISQDQKDEVLSQGKKVRKKLVRQSIEIEREVYDELLKCLSPDNRSQADEIFGKPLKLRANVDLLLSQLASKTP